MAIRIVQLILIYIFYDVNMVPLKPVGVMYSLIPFKDYVNFQVGWIPKYVDRDSGIPEGCSQGNVGK